VSRNSVPRHNAHLLVPEDLWKRAVAIAAHEGITVTALVIEGLGVAVRRREKMRTLKGRR